MNLPLTISSVNQVIDEATSVASGEDDPILSTKEALKKKGLVLSRAMDSLDWNVIRSFLSSSQCLQENQQQKDGNGTVKSNDMDVSMHFGIIVRRKIEENSTTCCCGVVTFHFAYSTWDGRVLYVDRLQYDNKTNEIKTNNDKNDETFEILLLQILAYITVQLDCPRLTWRHTMIPNWYSSGKSTVPDTLHGWLTLSMDEQAIDEYISESNFFNCHKINKDSINGVHEVKPQQSLAQNLQVQNIGLVESIVHECLSRIDESTSKPFRLRLATKADVDTILRLVQGLAIYEKEPDAVNVTVQHFLRDGFPNKNDTDEIQQPLFYCLLLDYIEDNKASDNKNNTNKDNSMYHTCGMAFYYFGYTFGNNKNDKDSGRFLYLEDLYLDEKYRKKGGGTLVMQVLAWICQALHCKQFIWQALNWNTPALTFYEKIGAKIQDGVLTSRFSNIKAMESFFSNIDQYY